MIYEEKVHGDKLEINCKIWIHIEIGQNTQKISQKDGPISQLIILNDNTGITSLPLPYYVSCRSYILVCKWEWIENVL